MVKAKKEETDWLRRKMSEVNTMITNYRAVKDQVKPDKEGNFTDEDLIKLAVATKMADFLGQLMRDGNQKADEAQRMVDDLTA